MRPNGNDNNNKTTVSEASSQPDADARSDYLCGSWIRIFFKPKQNVSTQKESSQQKNRSAQILWNSTKCDARRKSIQSMNAHIFSRKAAFLTICILIGSKDFVFIFMIGRIVGKIRVRWTVAWAVHCERIINPFFASWKGTVE